MTPTTPGEVTIELISAGRWGDNRTVSVEDLDQAVVNAVALQPYIKPRLLIGHSKPADELGMEQPAVGWLKPGSLRREGTTLLATFEGVPPIIMKALRERLYARSSLEAMMDFATTGAARDLETNVEGFKAPTGMVVTGCAILGSSVPACSTLADLATYLQTEKPMPDTIWIDGPALRGRDEREVMRLTAGEVRMAPKITLNERLDRVQRDIARLEARNHGLRRLIAEEKQDMKMMSSFQPASAAQSDGVKPLSTVFEDELEADLAAKGGNRDDPAQRAASARSTLIRWRSRPPSPNAPGADTAPSLADQLDSGEVSRAINAFMPTNAPIPSTSVANTTATTGVPAWARSSDAATAANKIKQAPYEGVTATTYGSRAVMSEPDDAPRYGARSAYGAATTKAMHTLAEKRGLDMSRPADRDRAAALHFAEGGVPLSRAGSFEQGLHAVLRDRLGVRPELVCMAENDDKRAQATRILAKERPDLVDSYRSPQPAAEDVREVLFNERIGDELRQVDPLLKDRFAIAVKRALANHAPLAPTHYGSRGA